MATRSRLTGVERWERETFSRVPERDAPFSTISGEPIRPLYTEEDLPVGICGWTVRSGCRGSFRLRAACTGRCIAGGCGRCGSSRGSGPRRRPIERFRYLLDHGQTGLSTAFDMPSLMGHDSDHPRSLGEVGREGVAIDSLADMEMLFDGIPLDRGERVDDDQRAGGDHAGVLRGRGRAAGDRPRAAGGDDPDRHPQGVHRAEGVVFPGRSGDAAGGGHDRVVRAGACRAGIRCRSAAITSARRGRRRRRSWRSRSRMG